MVDNIKIKNFGPIKEGNIDISPLTIFVGQNSSGKSFVSLVMHSLLNPFGEYKNLSQFSTKSFDCLLKNNPEIFLEFNEELMKYIDSKPDFSKDFFKFSSNKFDELIYSGIGLHYVTLIENRLKNNFSFDLSELDNIKFNNPFEISFNDLNLINDDGKIIATNFSDIFINATIEYDDGWLFRISKKDQCVLIKINYILLSEILKGHDMFSFLLYSTLADIFSQNIFKKSFYVPVSGDEISKDYNLFISREIKESIQSSDIEKDLLTSYLNSNRIIKNQSFYDLAVEMENEIFGGEIQFKKNDVNEELIFKDYKYGAEFKFSLISASIRQLAPLTNYLKYELQKGDTLIIEEIENHLHPENQRILVKYLVKLINCGLNIILTTHSDFILEQFNNFIRLGSAKAESLKNLNYSKDTILNPKDINIYNFTNYGDYNFIPEKIELNRTGFIDEVFTEVIEELYDESTYIINSEKR